MKGVRGLEQRVIRKAIKFAEVWNSNRAGARAVSVAAAELTHATELLVSIRAQLNRRAGNESASLPEGK